MFGVFTLTLIAVAAAVHPPPEYVINLDSAPSVRWNAVLDSHPDIVSKMNYFYGKFVPPSLVPLIEKLAGDLDQYLPQPYAAEISGLAQHMNASVGTFLLPSIIYDLTAFCTSIMAQDSKNQIWHGRNLDYGRDSDTADILKSITITSHFERGGKRVYSSVGYVGYVGILTGQKPNAFTFSLDQRGQGHTADALLNILVALLDKKATLTGFLIRDTFEQAPDFETAVKTLAGADTIAPSYMIVGGTQSGQGVVITKQRIGAADVWPLDVKNGRWYLVETNYDHWLPPPADDDRRTPAQRGMNATSPDGLCKNSLYKVLSTPPVLALYTTYTVVMSASQPGILQAWVRDQTLV